MARLMKMGKGAHWHAIVTMQKYAPKYRRVTGNDLDYDQKPSGEWQLIPQQAEDFANWWLDEMATQQVSEKWVIIVTKAYFDFRKELEDMGIDSGILDKIGLDKPFFDRVEPRNE